MRTLTFSDLNEFCPNRVLFKDHHDLDPAPLRGHKGSSCMFGIKSKVLMSTITVAATLGLTHVQS